MPTPGRHKAHFEEGKFYHVYNQSAGALKLFSNEENYRFFLHKFNQHLSTVWDVYAFCLLPNHFHFLIKVKQLPLKQPGHPDNYTPLLDINSESIRRYKNFCLSYSHAYKKAASIKSNVFSQHFKHILIEQDAYFSQLIFYIHLNPLHHGLKINWQQYPWSSYQRILQKGVVAPLSPYGQVLDWFHGPEAFISYHQNQQILYQCEFE